MTISVTSTQAEHDDLHVVEIVEAWLSANCITDQPGAFAAFWMRAGGDLNRALERFRELMSDPHGADPEPGLVDHRCPRCGAASGQECLWGLTRRPGVAHGARHVIWEREHAAWSSGVTQKTEGSS